MFNQDLSHDHIFWNQISVKYIAQLYQVYRLDFEMFDYDPMEYLYKHGLEKKAEELRHILKIAIVN